MLRDLNVSSGGKRDSTDPRVGVLASEIPTGFPLPAFLLNDVDAGFPNRLYSIEILTLPSAGTLYLDKAGAGSFTGAPDGAYTGTQRVKKYDPGVGQVSSADTTYALTIGTAATAPGDPVIGTAVAGNGYVDVFFTAPSSNGGATITGYTATLSTGESATGTSSPIRVTASNGVSRTATVRASNSVGPGAASSASNAVTPVAPVVITVPGAPTISTATAGDGFVDVFFTAPASSGGAAISLYTALLSTGESATGTSSPIHLTASNGVARTATVRATNSVGQGPASAASNSVTPQAVIVAPVTYDLYAFGTTVLGRNTISGPLRLSLVFADTPAPSERTIVLGSSSTSITS